MCEIIEMQWKKNSLIQLSTKDMQNLKEYLGFYVNVMRVLKSFIYSWINNSFLLTDETDLKDK